MRRLAIFDPVNGHQPMTTPDGRHTLVFNGAIYNFKALQAELESLGWIFRTQCDTEVLLAALSQWGQAALKMLRGMYAFALWDSQDESLLLARDPFGIKPLYFFHQGGRIVFASEIAALISSGSAPAEIDPSSVSEYLSWFSVPAPRTIYRGIFSLGAGEALRYSKGRVEASARWSLNSDRVHAKPCKSRTEFVAELRGRLDDSIRAHMLADVPVGAFLSGGLDSAVVVGLMARATGSALKTFSIGFEEDGFSEADEAQESARHFGSIHYTRVVTGAEVARDLDEFLAACDQPTGDGVNTYYASQTAQQGGVKVALSGLGGDELFGGYPSFAAVPRIAKWLPHWLLLPTTLRNFSGSALNRGGTRSRKLSDFLLHARDAHEIAALNRRVFSESRRRAMLAPDLLSKVGEDSPLHPNLAAIRAEAGNADPESLVSLWELRTYMADLLLRDSDVMSMRHSLELRVPFVDRPLIEWLWDQPALFKFDRRRPKSALAEAAADVLPTGLAKRRKKGFTLPFPIWMRASLRPFLEDTFSIPSIERSGFFSPTSVRELWRRFATGGEDREWSRVWSIAVLIAFVNRRHSAVRSPC
jgi:asparagine synthase (glutamine-hydrolysing)